MRKTLLLAIACLIGTLGAYGQSAQYEYGTPAELKGLKKVLITTGADANYYNDIKKQIEKADIGLSVVDSDDADILLAFNGDGRRRGTGLIALPRGTRENPRLRVLYNWEPGHATAFGSPAAAFAKKFIEEYKKANK